MWRRVGNRSSIWRRIHRNQCETEPRGEGARIAAQAKGDAIATVAMRVTLGRGVHTVRLSNATAWMPDCELKSQMDI